MRPTSGDYDDLAIERLDVLYRIETLAKHVGW
jgi:hypothetical protein